jgi:hypothetical protein
LNSFSSLGQRNLVGFTFNSAIYSKVIFAVGINSRGCLESSSKGNSYTNTNTKLNCVVSIAALVIDVQF